MTMHGTPQYDTRWYDSRKRTTRLGFENGCVERKPVAGTQNVEVMLYYSKNHCTNTGVYVVRRSDWNSRVTGTDVKDYWWEGTCLKQARKMLNTIAKGVPVSILDLKVSDSKVVRCDCVQFPCDHRK